MSFINFKSELESILMITDWSPTEKELIEIATFLSESEKELSKNDVEKIVYDVVGSYESILLEGVDNSDLTTLLKLATKTVSDNDK